VVLRSLGRWETTPVWQRKPNIMSIHVKLSEQAEVQIRLQRRNSKIASIFISGLIVFLVFLVFGLIVLKAIPHETEPFKVIYAAPTEPVAVKPLSKAKTIPSNPAPPANRPNDLILSNDVSHISIPTVDVEMPGPSVGMSDEGFFGSHMGLLGKTGETGNFKKIDVVMSKRCSREDRLDRIREMGGRIESEVVVERGLEWLKANQNPDGSWSNKNVSAMTGFGVLVYLGRCETPLSAKYGESCLKGIIRLVDLGMKNDGRLSMNTSDKHWPYEHAISTYALCESLSFCEKLKIEIPDLEEMVRKSVSIIIDHQHPKSGGWDYGYETKGNRGGDLSIAAWQIQALKAASHTGLEIKGLKSSQIKAMEYVVNLQGENGGFGYTGKANGEGYAKLTGAGVLCLQMSGKKYSSEIRRGARHIGEFVKFDYDGKDSNLYSHYYESQAMMARGGSEWRKYNEVFRDQLIHSQNPDGGWKVPGSGGLYTDPFYRNCLNILMLEVYYRFLPGTGSL